MKIAIIVAVSKNGVIGVGNAMPWHLPVDLKYFKATTLHHPIVMGRKTYESIGRLLPGRENIIITRDSSYRLEGATICHSTDEVLAYALQNEFSKLFVIGGDNLYRQLLPIADEAYITRVDTVIENGTAFFPELDATVWEKVSSVHAAKDEKNSFDCEFEVYKNTVH
ncbi:MAG: hypothetical protein RIQ62_990 [Bacteroidota bacterium]|jgi:dihydrofolate reductase